MQGHWYRTAAPSRQHVNVALDETSFAPIGRDEVLERAAQCAYPRTRGDEEPTTDDRTREQR